MFKVFNALVRSLIALTLKHQTSLIAESFSPLSPNKP